MPSDLKLHKRLENEERADHYSYRKAVGTLMYIMVCTRPDLAFTVKCLSQYMNDPSRLHWNAVRHVLRYLKDTADYAIMYKKSDDDDSPVIY